MTNPRRNEEPSSDAPRERRPARRGFPIRIVGGVAAMATAIVLGLTVGSVGDVAHGGSGQPDLIITKTHTPVSPTVDSGFTWILTVENIGDGPASVDSSLLQSNRGLLVFDILPLGPTYGEPIVELGDVTGTLLCSTEIVDIQDVDESPLVCVPQDGTVTIEAGQSFTVRLPVSVEDSGTLVNPAFEDACVVDIQNDINESDETNNVCGDTVDIGASTVSVECLDATGPILVVPNEAWVTGPNNFTAINCQQSVAVPGQPEPQQPPMGIGSIIGTVQASSGRQVSVVWRLAGQWEFAVGLNPNLRTIPPTIDARLGAFIAILN